MATEKWSYEALADAWEAILWQSEDFQAELRALCNPQSYLDRKLCAQFCDEVRLAQRFVMAVLFWVSGWTEAAFDIALDRAAAREAAKRSNAS